MDLFFLFFWSSFQLRCSCCVSVKRSGCVQTHPREHARLHVRVSPGGRKSRLCEEGRTASSPKPLDEKKPESFVKTHLRDFFFIIIICLPFDERDGSSSYTGEVERDGGCGSGREPGNGLSSNFISVPCHDFARFSLRFSATGDLLRQAMTEHPVLWILWWLI